MSREDLDHERLSTADLVAGTEHREMQHRGPDGVPLGAPVMDERPQRDDRMHGGMAEPRPEMRPPQQRPGLEADGGMVRDAGRPAEGLHEELAALFPPQVAQDFRSRWDALQIGFVDDPRRAVQQADELVAQVMKHLAGSFAEQRSALERGLGQGNDANSTEHMRMALRSYRSFFQRLLSL
jgi:hypothetical protein